MAFAAQRYRVSRDNAVFARPVLSAKNNCQYDRFIPCRSAMDMDIAHYMLTNPNKGKENVAVVSPKKEAYRKCLEECVFGDRTRILSFKSKPQTPVDPFFCLSPSKKSSVHPDKPAKKRRHIPKTPKRMLDAPFLVDDFYLNLLDWGSDNTLAIALGHTVYLWNGTTCAVSQLPDFDEETGHVTSVSWAQNGRQIAVGLDNSDVQLWDTTSGRLLRTLKNTHSSRVGSLSWNNHLLTTGGMDGRIVNNDVRIRSHVVQTYSGHTDEVCGLKWAASGNKLASGGGDSLVHIWDVSMASTRPPPNQHQWLHRLENHTAAVKALAWSPFQSNLLASGGGEMDQCIKFWNTSTGACVNSVDIGSQVTALLWNTKEEELLSSHGYSDNQLTLWKYPSMDRVTELTGHTSRVLSMAQSPDDCTVASLGGDETLRFWQVFGTPEVAKPVKSRVSHTSGPMSMRSHIR